MRQTLARLAKERHLKNSKKVVSAKPVKTAAKKTLSHDQRSAIARLAALKAHMHKSFAKTRTQTLAQATANFRNAVKKAPQALRARFAA
jgi:hypothetical protein